MCATTSITGKWFGRCNPAFRLMIATSWLAPDDWSPQQADAVREAYAGGVNWAEYTRLVERHRTSALSWAALKRVPGIPIPEGVAATLKRRSDACRVQAAMRLQLLVSVLKAFKKAGIPAMPMKGPMLSLELYGDAGLRQSKDLDILVHHEDIPTARNCLLEIGWRSTKDDAKMTPRQSEFLSKHEHHISFIHQRQHCELELHWRTREDSNDASVHRWAASVPFEWQGCSWLAPSAVDLAVDLCEHGGSHAWFRAKWLGDMARLVADHRVDAAALLETACASGQERAVLLCLQLLQDAYGFPTPATVHLELRRPDPFVIERAVLKLTDPNEIGVPGPMHVARERLLNSMYAHRLWPRKSFRDTFEETALHSADFELIRLPDMLFWLYVPLRPFLWLWRQRRRLTM